MNILAVNKFYHIFGGSERYFFELNHLHEKAGHLVIPFAMKHPENFPNDYDEFFVSEVNYWDNPTLVEKVKAAGRILYSSEARRKLQQLLERTNPNIAHIHLISHQISPSILPIIKDFGIPIVQTLHDYKPICPTYSLVSKGMICERCNGGRFYHAALQRCNHDSFSASALNSVEMYLHHALKWYDIPNVYITPSKFMQRKMIEFGLPADKFVHVPNFVDIKKFSDSKTADNYFVYIGRLTKIKGLSTLLEATNNVKNVNFRLFIIGDGPQRQKLEEIKNRMNLTFVKFMGYQPTEKIISILKHASFSVLPSEWYENCPLSVLESMAMGKPVIGSRIGGIPELIEHGEDGFLIEPGNKDDLAEKVQILMSNPKLCREMGERARRKIATKYNPEIHYQKIISIYEHVGKQVQ